MFGSAPQSFTYTVTPGSPGVFTIAGHDFHEGEMVEIISPCLYLSGCSAVVPGGLFAQTTYTVRSVNGDTFTLETGGNPVAVTSTGSGFLNGRLLMRYEPGSGEDILYSGKVFSQNYRWSFDYVHWREGREPNRP